MPAKAGIQYTLVAPANTGSRPRGDDSQWQIPDGLATDSRDQVAGVALAASASAMARRFSTPFTAQIEAS